MDWLRVFCVTSYVDKRNGDFYKIVFLRYVRKCSSRLKNSLPEILFVEIFDDSFQGVLRHDSRFPVKLQSLRVHGEHKKCYTNEQIHVSRDPPSGPLPTDRGPSSSS